MPKWFKYTIVWTFYIIALILCFGGTSVILGIPLGLIGVLLQRYFDIHID